MVEKKNNHDRDSYGLSDEDILAFIQAWREDFGERLTTEEAREKARAILFWHVL